MDSCRRENPEGLSVQKATHLSWASSSGSLQDSHSEDTVVSLMALVGAQSLHGFGVYAFFFISEKINSILIIPSCLKWKVSLNFSEQ